MGLNLNLGWPSELAGIFCFCASFSFIANVSMTDKQLKLSNKDYPNNASSNGPPASMLPSFSSPSLPIVVGKGILLHSVPNILLEKQATWKHY